MSGRLIGYARVSTGEQGTAPHRDAGRLAGERNANATLLHHVRGHDRPRPPGPISHATPHAAIQVSPRGRRRDGELRSR